jgi:hypothetical protein
MNEEEFWHVTFTFKDGRISEHFCSADEYDELVAPIANEDEIGLKKVEIIVTENSLVT